MKINPYLAKNTDIDFSVFSSMIVIYLEHSLQNDTPATEIKRGVREILSMMYRIMPQNQKYIQYISTQYWTKKALEFANFDLTTPSKILKDINAKVLNEATVNSINIKKGPSKLVLEHAVPVAILAKNIIQLFQDGQSIEEYIKKNFIFVTCTKIEDKQLNDAGWQKEMPDENDTWSRYKETNIEVFDTETGNLVS